MTVYPTLNLNGSDPIALVSALRKVDTAVRDALEALALATPHGRDYQIGEHTREEAMEVHRERQSLLKAVRRSIGDEVAKIVDQPLYAKANQRELERLRREFRRDIIAEESAERAAGS